MSVVENLIVKHTKDYYTSLADIKSLMRNEILVQDFEVEKALKNLIKDNRIEQTRKNKRWLRLRKENQS